MHQLIMTSAAYQQSSVISRPVTRKSVARDAAHTNSLNTDSLNTDSSCPKPRRLEAEAIRDSLLFVSGVLDTNMFGPGTLDEASKRRSIYFTVKRSQLIPSMQCLDAPEPLVSQGTRPTTTVAPQALMLMNSPPLHSWAGSFAARLADGGEKPALAVLRAYALAF